MMIAIALSVAIHFGIGPLFARLHRQLDAGDIVVTSTSLRLERRTAPEPHPAPRPLTIAPSKAVPQKTQLQRSVVVPRRLVFAPHVTPRPEATNAQRPLSGSPALSRATLERQERQYEKVIAQAKADNNPLAVPSSTPAAYKPYRMSFNGSDNPLRSGQGILYPVKSWKQDGYNYYYVDYTMVFADGARDQGHVPWPIRYKPNEDPFALHYRGRFPLPAPLPDYVLPESELPLNPTLRPYFPNLYPNGE